MPKATNVVTGVMGHKGGGKTLTQTLFVWLEYLQGKTVYSNYWLEFPFEWLTGEDVVELASHLSNAVICIDELHEYADARNSMSIQNKRVADLFLQSRHRTVNIYYTTQFEDQIDKRIRRITDVKVVAENLYRDTDDDGDDDLFKIIIQDRRMSPSRIKSQTLYLEPIFDMYDSTEIINPFEYKRPKKKGGKVPVN